MTNKDGFDLELEEETSEEEFDEVSLDETAAEEKPAKKKSGGGGLVAVLGLLVVLGGGAFAAVKFLGVQLPFDIPGLAQQTAQAPAQPAQQPAMTASADLPADSLPPQPAVPGESSTEVVGALPDAGAITPDETASQDDASINAPWDAMADAGTQPVETAAPAAVDTSNIVDPFAETTAAAATPAETPATTPAAPAETAAETNIVDPFAATVPEQPAPQTTEVAAPAVETPAAAVAIAAPSENPADKARIADLEKQLADSQKALKSAQDELAKKSADLAKAQSDLKTAQKDAQDAAAAVKAAPKAAAKETATSEAKPAATPKAAPKAAAAPAAKRVTWVLRSAKPGMAWVSEKGSNEMRTVSVGDTLSGIGKVTSIAADAQGRWVVNGTRGSINQ